MNEIVGIELQHWCDSLNVANLNEYDMTVINIIINHYGDLALAGGTAGGKRAGKFAEYVNEKGGICDKHLDVMSVGTIKESGRIKQLKKLSVDSFRGFSVSREFNLDKQYVFLYGPNGSGKSGFSEALEYGLLGFIQEAEAKKIKLSDYIKNTSTKRSEKPQIVCIYDDNTEGEAIPDYELYRFAFVEKNRISDFSHISVLNSRSQSERISALFGLSEFNDFVQGFTLNFDYRYLPIKSTTEDSFKESKAVRDSKESQMKKVSEELKIILDSSQEIVKKTMKSEIVNIDDALAYLRNPQNGLLMVKTAERNKMHKDLLCNDKFDEIKSIAHEICEEISKLSEYKNKLSDKAMQVNYKSLYEAIHNLQKTDTCPACGTPIEKAARNPYLYANEQLRSFSELERIQDSINSCSRNIKLNIQKALDFFAKNSQLIYLLQFDVDGVTSTALHK